MGNLQDELVRLGLSSERKKTERTKQVISGRASVVQSKREEKKESRKKKTKKRRTQKSKSKKGGASLISSIYRAVGTGGWGMQGGAPGLGKKR